MKIIQRLRNLIKLSEIEITSDMDVDTKRTFNKMFKKLQIVEEKPKMAQIIKMKTDEQIIKDLLNEK